MTPQDFKRVWTETGDKLTPISPERLTDLNLKSKTIDFLTQAGLPVDAAPFLWFADDSKDKFKGISRLSDQFDFLEEEFKKWIVIGSCADGDPIAVNTEADDEIARLDHENNFEPDFFNSSVESLAECLVIYRRFVADMVRENGPDAFLDANFTDYQFETMKSKILLADNKALLDSGFWKETLDIDLGMRADFNKKK